MLSYVPRPYQQQALQAIAKARREGRNLALVVMASGLGKTLLSAFDVQRFLEAQGGRVLYLCHQNDILAQAREKFESVLGMNYSYANLNGYEKDFQDADFIFASFQIMRDWRVAFFPNEFAYIVVDESHHSEAPTYRPTLDYFKPKFMLGITATPDRADLKDIKRIYGQEVFNLALEDALAEGLLTSVDYRLMTDEIQNVSSFKTSVGKISISALNRAIFVPKRDEEIVRLIEEKVVGIKNPRIIIFAPSIVYCDHFAKLMTGAAAIHSHMESGPQQSRLKAFRAGKLRALVTVDKFNEGIDLPDANVVVFLRSTSSRTIFLQQLGRGLRLSPGKVQVLVLDFVANCERLEMIQNLWRRVEAAYEKLPGLTREKPISVKVGSVHFDEIVLDVLDILAQIRTGYTKEVLKKQLQDLARELGRTPRSKEIAAASKAGKNASRVMFAIYFGSLTKALDAAGLLVNRRHGVTREDLLEPLRNLAKELGRSPNTMDMREAGKARKVPSMYLYGKFFASFKDAMADAGLPYKLYAQRAAWTREKLKQLLVGLYRELGRVPTYQDVEKAYKPGQFPSHIVFRKQFGKPENLAVVVGASSKPIKPTQWTKYTDDQLVSQIRHVRARLGRWPQWLDVVELRAKGLDIASESTFADRLGLGSFRKAIERVRAEGK